MVGAKVCELTEDLLWFVCGLYVVCMWFVCGLYVVCMWFVCGNFDVSPSVDAACQSRVLSSLPYLYQ